jgi:2-alkenal reductase
LVTNAPVTDAQAAIVGIMPTQEVLSTLYEQIAPSVVNIQVTADRPMNALPESPVPGFPFDIPGEPGTPQPQQGEGSGFIFDMEGHIVTNNHVVENASQIVVNFSNGMWADAELVAADPQADLAVIKVTPPDGLIWQPLTLAAEDSIRVGYYVVAVGSPFGLDETLTTGVVSALGRSFSTGDVTSGANYSLPDVIQTDAAINPGNSIWPVRSSASTSPSTRRPAPTPVWASPSRSRSYIRLCRP